MEERNIRLACLAFIAIFFGALISVQYLIRPSIEVFENVEPLKGKIVYESSRDLSVWICIMNVDGSNVTKFIEGYCPDLSPDGKKIAFCRDAGFGMELYVVSVKGGVPIKLAGGRTEIAENPAWSPDSKKIAFELAPVPPGKPDIYIINADGSHLKRLTTKGGSHPRWWPDGKRIAFESNRDGKWGIYVINSDGSNETKLPIEEAIHPDIAPDGKRMVFSDFSRICLFDFEKGSVIQLTQPICWKKILMAPKF
ncbi:MAG: hypothetical protein QXI39_07810 [Candidatus Bathyarchaeia archaeon]